MKYFVKHIALLLPVWLMAQPADTLKRSFVPTGLRLGADVVPLVYGFADKRFGGYEFSADVDF